MSNINKRSAIIETMSKATTNKKYDEMDYEDSVKLIKELASNPNPMNLYELNQIVAYSVDTILDTRLKYIEMIAEVKRTDFNERPKFKTKTEGIKAYWQAIGGTADRSKVGHKYSGLDIEELSAMPVAEWAEIAAGRYDFVELLRDTANEFEIKAAQKVQNTLYAGYEGLAAPIYASGNGVIANAFDPLLTAMQRFGGRAAIIGDYEALQKLPNLTSIQGRTSDNIIDEVNSNGLIGTYKGAPVIKLDNPYVGFQGYETALDKGLIYIVPAASDDLKTLKVQFAGDVVPMQEQTIKDRSYTMRFDKHMGAGLVDAGRHTLAIYKDETLSTL
ncbi:hypothetical protein [Paenibacillus xylanexedens]|uniref:hypothetical protein n=1 Tax=Paenibacillus xylanexedens TaxID=528191 RepID=UPI000F533FBA|nr:hypothetical protein [Paenibacillus xylanexedens]RPK31846.1 hypothetical protein EDO6_02473 [Paenibacillus xylanexedens]